MRDEDDTITTRIIQLHSVYTPIWSVAVCATDVTDVSKDYKWLLALQCTKTAENIAGNWRWWRRRGRLWSRRELCTRVVQTRSVRAEDTRHTILVY